jgi:hypothetical protein
MRAAAELEIGRGLVLEKHGANGEPYSEIIARTH